MKPVTFTECNYVYAKDQPEYLPLPALKTEDGTVTSCWALTLCERLRILFSGKIWCSILTFNKALQPILLQTTKPIFEKRTPNEH